MTSIQKLFAALVVLLLITPHDAFAAEDPGVILEGRVYADQSVPRKDAKVVYVNHTDGSTTSTLTDKDGQFAFEKPLSATAAIWAVDGDMATTPTLVRPGPSSCHDLYLRPAGSQKGEVHEPTYAPAPGVKVQLFYRGRSEVRWIPEGQTWIPFPGIDNITHTDENGEFLFQHVWPPDEDEKFDNYGFLCEGIAREWGWIVLDGRRPVLRGIVQDEKTGQPIPEFTVTYNHSGYGGGKGISQDFKAADGRFEYDVSSAYHHYSGNRIRISAPGYVTQEFNFYQGFESYKGGLKFDRGWGLLRMTRLKPVTVLLIDKQNGKGVPNIPVYFNSYPNWEEYRIQRENGRQPYAITDEHGQFEIHELSDTAEITVCAPGFAYTSFPATKAINAMKNDDTPQLRIELEREAAVIGDLGPEWAGKEISLSTHIEDGITTMDVTKTDASGRFAFRNLYELPYYFHVYIKGPSISGKLKYGKVADVGEIFGDLTLKVTATEHGNLVNHHALLRKVDGAPFEVGYADTERENKGLSVFKKIPPGRYELGVRAFKEDTPNDPVQGDRYEEQVREIDLRGDQEERFEFDPLPVRNVHVSIEASPGQEKYLEGLGPLALTREPLGRESRSIDLDPGGRLKTTETGKFYVSTYHYILPDDFHYSLMAGSILINPSQADQSHTVRFPRMGRAKISLALEKVYPEPIGLSLTFKQGECEIYRAVEMKEVTKRLRESEIIEPVPVGVCDLEVGPLGNHYVEPRQVWINEGVVNTIQLRLQKEGP